MGTQETVGQVGLGVGGAYIVLQAALEAGWSLLLSTVPALGTLILIPLIVHALSDKLSERTAGRQAHKRHMVKKAVEPLISDLRSDGFPAYSDAPDPIEGLYRADFGTVFTGEPPDHSAWDWLLEHEDAFRQAWEDYQARRRHAEEVLTEACRSVYEDLVEGTDCEPAPHRMASTNLQVDTVLTPLRVLSLARAAGNGARVPEPQLQEGMGLQWLSIGGTSVVHGRDDQVKLVKQNLRSALAADDTLDHADRLGDSLNQLEDARRRLLQVADRIIEEGGPRGTCSRCTWRALLAR